MKYAFSSIALAALTMAPTATAHMIMAKPQPFGNPNNSPLDPSGSDYPCKIAAGGSAAGGPMNQFKVGEKQTLEFTGSAVHGGGSCQLAVTLDKAPTKDSKFKVIHSIEGGCPGVNGPSTFDFTPPKELPNGEAVFAWTWFNRIGNREMYMNCASITVSGGSDDKAGFEALPDMAIANIQVGGGATCKTPEASDYTFKDPGASVQKVGSGPFAELCGGAASGGSGNGQGQPGQGAPSGGAPGGGATQTGNNGLYTPPASQAPPATQAPAASGAPAAPSQAPAVSSQAPAGSSPPDAVTSTMNTLVTVTAPTGGASAAPTGGASAPAAQPSSAPQPSAAPGAGAGSAGCTDGAMVCNGDSQFGICNHGNVVWQAVAAGTKCEGGKIAKRGYSHRIQRVAV